MKQMSWLLILILVSSTNAFGQGGVLYVKLKQENVRAEPNGSKIGEVLAGTEVKVLERKPNWVKVQFSGWIWEQSLTSDSTGIYGFTVRASHILVETEEEATQILSKIMEGAEFEELARQYSIDSASGAKGGDLGKFGRGDLLVEFEDTVFRLKVGQISGIVKTDLGYHIIKRTE